MNEIKESNIFSQLEPVLEQRYAGESYKEAKQHLEWESATVFAQTDAHAFRKCKKILEEWQLDCSEISGRGSMGSSIMAYLMGILDIDPISYSLYPEFVFGIKGEKMPDLELNIPGHLIDVVKRISVGGIQIKLIPHEEMGMLQRLSGQTGIPLKKVPSDDSEVLSLLTEEKKSRGRRCLDIIPEFEKVSVKEMISVLKPKNFGQFCKVLGLSYGTGMWEGNGEQFAKEGLADVDSLISCREDVFEHCLSIEMSRETAYEITENIRMGRVFRNRCDQWEDWKRGMLERDTPEWFVRSCERTEYLFPRAHLVSYMRMHMRMGWFSLHFPEEFESVAGQGR